MGAAPLRHGRSRPNWVAGAALTLAAPRAIVIESRASGGAAVASPLLDQRHVSERSAVAVLEAGRFKRLVVDTSTS